MDLSERKMAWWVMVLIGVIVVAISIFLLADRYSGLIVLTWLVGIGAAVFGIYNLYLALRNKDHSSDAIPYLVHGLLNLILMLLIIVIHDTQALLGIIVSCWLIVFGVFEVFYGRRGDNAKRARIGAILVIVGLVVLIIPLVLSIDYVILIGIVGLLFGIALAALGIISKLKFDQRTSGGRSNVI